ncbi:hypothetical protein SETIT_7G171100v2 [Setaria italica]|uniref:Non-haem dioxygenase N-terminal domain-containing protein n=1 Tax=Setaria italica TaxID=4555 RepID=A0A368RWS5_SETIT|nr:hypothetical protein SETIT_7G171100v2 [Setaria italica]
MAYLVPAQPKLGAQDTAPPGHGAGPHKCRSLAVPCPTNRGSPSHTAGFTVGVEQGSAPCKNLPRTPAIMPAFTESRAAAEPPLAESYLDLLRRGGGGIAPPGEGRVAVQERELPLIDLGCLMTTSGQQGSRSAREARAACAYAMARAASEWGFFQVTGHGVGRALLERLRAEQARLFRLPFETKARAGLLNGSYRWGAPTATSLRHLSWSEAFHVPLASISGSGCDFGELGSLS